MSRKADKFNRTVMLSMMFMAVVVIGCVFFFLYWAGNAYDQKEEQSSLKSEGDSLVIEVSDSTFFEAE